MGYPLELALRYMSSKKRAFVSVGTAFAMLGVTLGVAALATVMSVTGGFQQQFREKVLGVNAHVLVLKYSIDFHEYGDVMKKMDGLEAKAPIIPFCPWDFCPMRTTHVTGVAPFIINPMMVTHGDRTATGVLLKGVDPELMPKVLDLPKHILPGGSLDGLRKPGAKPAERPRDPFRPTPLSTGHTIQNVPVPQHQDQQQHGINDPLDGGLQSLLNAIAEENQRDVAPTPTVAPQTSDDLDAGVPSLSGALTPDGGYLAKLPDTDVLPDSIDPDPCKSPEQVTKMPGVVIGKTLAKQLNVDIGDCVQVTSPTTVARLEFATAHRQAVSRDRHVRSRVRPVRQQARLHGPLRSRSLLRTR
jgi:lipoprotein-releasing system permease protein